MTSKECFVHIVLPGDTDFVTAGRFERSVDRHGLATGRFVYGKSYLARENAVPIDPMVLKLSAKTYAMENDWKLSPAYDLTPSMPISLERRDLALECGDMGRYAHADNLLSQCARFLLVQDEAKAIIDTMQRTVKDRWYDIARREGVTEKDCETIRTAFAYEGFRLKASAALS